MGVAGQIACHLVSHHCLTVWWTRAPKRVNSTMTMFHFINCSALTYVPLYIVYLSTSMRDGGRGKCLFYVALACTASQFLQMVLVATFIPHSHPSTFEFTQELMQAVIGSLEILAMGCTYNLPQLRACGGYAEKVVCLGLGWALTESLLKRAAPLWIGAAGNEFDWKYIRIAIEANLSLVTYMAFARLISRYNARDVDTTTRVSLSALALVHSIVGSSIMLAPEALSPAVVLGLRAVWVLLLWLSASYLFFGRSANKKD